MAHVRLTLAGSQLSGATASSGTASASGLAAPSAADRRAQRLSLAKAIRKRAVTRYWMGVAFCALVGAVGVAMIGDSKNGLFFFVAFLAVGFDSMRNYKLYRQSVEYGLPELSSRATAAAIAGAAVAAAALLLLVAAVLA